MKKKLVLMVLLLLAVGLCWAEIIGINGTVRTAYGEYDIVGEVFTAGERSGQKKADDLVAGLRRYRNVDTSPPSAVEAQVAQYALSKYPAWRKGVVFYVSFGPTGQWLYNDAVFIAEFTSATHYIYWYIR